MVPGSIPIAVVLLGLLGCTSGSDSPALQTEAPGAAIAPIPEPLFECRRDSDRGFERIVEVSRTDNTSVIHVETDYWGGATGGVDFGMSCLADACRRRGFASYVLLSSRPVRYGTAESPGNTWEATVGFLTAADEDVAAAFPGLTEAGKVYTAWPATGVQASSVPGFVGQVMGSDTWELFSSIHFRYRQPGEPASDDHSEADLAERADEAERRLEQSGKAGRRTRSLGSAAKAAALAGRWDSAEAWARELLDVVPPSDSGYGQAVHDAHTALGLVAVHEGDLDAAQIHLLKSGMTTGSPVLGSFGPNMSLARALIQAGKTDVVLQYFDQCASFWDMGQEDLAKWRTEVEQGRLPVFGANLFY